MSELAGWLVAVVLAAVLGAMAWRARRVPPPPPPAPGPDPSALDDDELQAELRRAAEELRRRGL